MAHVTSVSSGEHHGSIYPLTLAVGAALTLLGLLQPLLALPGIVVLLGSVYGWVREDVRELAHEGPTPGASDYRWGVVFLIAGEVVLFGALFTYWFWVRGFAPTWPPTGLEAPSLSLVLVNSVFLFASGWTAHVAETRLFAGREREFRRYLLATVALGAVFLAGQAYEYAHAGFSPASGTFGTAFFALTGVHGFHVLAGLVVLATLFVLSRTGRLGPERASGASGGILYWHFVDLVWVFILVVVYLRWV